MNSVWLNLSVNPHFRKGCKAPYGRSPIWVLADDDKYFQAVQVRLFEIFLFLNLVLKFCPEEFKKMRSEHRPDIRCVVISFLVCQF
jgi:hypothetical protein